MKSFDEFDLGVWTPNVDLNSFDKEFRGLLGSIAPDLGSWMNGLRPAGLLNNLFSFINLVLVLFIEPLFLA